MIDDIQENQIAPPSSPLTVKINLAILDFVWSRFAQKYLPAFETVITSSYRTQEHNEKVGGAANSAHVHGLAYDVVLRQGEKIIPLPMAQKVFAEYVKPNWPGYALFELADNKDSSWHIHLNLSRQITTYAGIMGVALLGVVGIAIVNAWGDKK